MSVIRKNLILFLLIAFSLSGKNFSTLRELFPPAMHLDNFKLDGEVVYYDRDNLWEYINGAAPGYVAYGFQELATFVVLTPDEKYDYAVDIYDMGDSLNAFGIFSQETSVEGRTSDFGSACFQSAGNIYFWTNRFYVKLMAYDNSEESLRILKELTKQILEKLPDPGKKPAIFSVFPEHYRIENSEKFTKNDVLGQDYFHNGYSLDYRKRDQSYKIFLIETENSASAQQKFKKYRNYVKNSGELNPESIQVGEESFMGKDLFYGTLLAVREEKFILIILGYPEMEKVESIASGIFKKLSERGFLKAKNN